MPRIRTIKPEFWEDEGIATLSRDARLLFIGAWNLADDEGLLRWTPAFIKSALFMYDDDVDLPVCEQLMAEIVAGDMVFPYVGGKAHQKLGFIIRFRKHQKINRPQPSKLPAPSLQNADVRLMYSRRDGHVCHLCGREILERVDPRTKGFDDWTISIDHLTTVDAGGSDYPTNLRASHQTCNKGRRVKTVDEAIAYQTSKNSQSTSPTLPSLAVIHSLNEAVSDSLPEGNGKEGEEERESATRGTVVPASETDGARANRLAKAFTDRVKLSNFPAVALIVRKAIKAGYNDPDITAALVRLAEDKRSVTTDTLRTELEGRPPPRGQGDVWADAYNRDQVRNA